MSDHVELAPAKLTVSLRITGVRDDGYHLIDAEMVSLDLADTLTFTDSQSGRAGDGDRDRDRLEVIEASTGVGVPADRSNTVARALAAVGRRAHVRLEKRIPAGGGLGGASADAAAVLRWAGVDDVAVAVAIGADVPFCVRGGRARVTGIGEVVDPLAFVAQTFTLGLPPFGCATPAVYRAWDELGGPSASGANDLEAAALRVEPRLALWRDRLGDATGQVPTLAGSGSTWFVPGAFPGDGRIVVRSTPPITSIGGAGGVSSQQ